MKVVINYFQQTQITPLYNPLALYYMIYRINAFLLLLVAHFHVEPINLQISTCSHSRQIPKDGFSGNLSIPYHI